MSGECANQVRGEYADLERAFREGEGEEKESYEKLCREHIEKYVSSAASYIQETELNKRVSHWRKKLEPLLSLHKKRPPFQLKQTSLQILQKFSSSCSLLPFHSIVEGMQHFQVARTFVATLQLINNGNLRLEDKQNLQFAFLNDNVKDLQENFLPPPPPTSTSTSTSSSTSASTSSSSQPKRLEEELGEEELGGEEEEEEEEGDKITQKKEKRKKHQKVSKKTKKNSKQTNVNKREELLSIF